MSHLPERDDTGQYPSFTWPGAYTIIYCDREGNALCPKCASREIDQAQEVIDCDTYDEGPTIQCDDCGVDIESSYGEGK